MDGWTQARVMEAYSEWRALSRHAEDVFECWATLTGEAAGGFERLCLPTWVGSGWPGEQCEVTAWDSTDDYETRHERFPMAHLWSDEWIAEAEEKRRQWQRSEAALAQKRRDRAEYARLRALFEEES